MKKPSFKIETWQLLFVIAASAVAVVFLNSLAFGFSPATVADSLIYTFFIAFSVMLGILYLAPKIYDLSPAVRFSIIAIAIFVTTFCGIFIVRLILIALGVEKFILPGLRTSVFSLVISYTFGLSAYFYLHSQTRLRRTAKLLRQKELDEAKAKSLAAEAQLASLESRIHPHFLFNTLNSIAALIKENPDEAEKMVEKLSALLRYSLDDHKKSLVPLEKELEITGKYLEIEKARFAERLDYKFFFEEGVKKINVPPLSVQTLVENAVKHVASKSSKKTEISISVFPNGANFIVEVEDNGAGFSDAEIKSGHGLDNLRQRLKNIFGGNADLEIVKQEAGGKARLKIPYSNE